MRRVTIEQEAPGHGSASVPIAAEKLESIGRLRIALSSAGSRAGALVALGSLTLVLLLAAAVPQQGVTPPLEYAHWRSRYAPLSAWLETAALTTVGRSAWVWWASAVLIAGLILYIRGEIVRLIRGAKAWSAARIAPARLASFCLHLSLLVGGVALAMSQLTRFAGYTELAPGASLVDATGRYLAIQAGPWAPEPTGLTLRLDALHLSSWPDGSLKEQRARLSVHRGGQHLAQADVDRGQIGDLAGLSVLLGAKSGPALLMVADDGAGRRAGWVHFPEWPRQDEVTASVAVPQSPARLAISLQGATADGAGDATIIVRPLDAMGSGSPTRLRVGDSFHIGGTRLSFAALDAWTSVTVTRDHYVTAAFVAAGMGLAALAVIVAAPGRSRP
ncbi:MAG: hypothetical protein U0821_23470 [Chloroflexota bacterium]